jgi:hypothetical protein
MPLSHLRKIVLDTARETVARFYEQRNKEKTNLPIGADVRDAIDAHLKIVPIASLLPDRRIRRQGSLSTVDRLRTSRYAFRNKNRSFP